MIKYRIMRSKLSANPDGYAGRVLPRGVVGLDDIAREIADLGTAISLPDVLDVLQHYHYVVAKMLARGETVNTPAARYRVGMRGTFTDEGDAFDPRRHELTVRVTAGPLLLEAVRRAPVELQIPGSAAPNPLTYVDTATGERNGLVTPGRVGRVIGRRLQFDPADPLQGIFFLSEDGTETRVEVVGWNKACHLLFLVPDMPPGSYKLQVRAPVGTAGVRTGEVGEPLRVTG